MSEGVIRAIEEGRVEPLYLVTGDRVVAEPAALEIAQAAAGRFGCEVETVRHPASLDTVLADLRTLSLFAPGKVVLVVDSHLFADDRAIAELIDEAARAVPIASGDDLSDDERRAAGRLLHALRLADVDPDLGSAEEAIGRLPADAFTGGSTYRGRNRNRGRGKRQAADLQSRLVELLDRARQLELVGWADTDVAELAELLRGGLPPQHLLVMAERTAARDHPLVAALRERDALVALEAVEQDRKGRWHGLDGLVERLTAETGVAIDRPAVAELVRRTLQKNDYRKGGGTREASTERFAGEYRKLASLSGGATIDRRLVETAVDDRGDESVWDVLDAIGEGKAADALQRIDRLLAAADVVDGERLSCFFRIADFALTLTTVAGCAREAGVPRGERNYNRFKQSLFPRLTALDSAPPSLVRLHPFRAHRAYLAASRLPARLLAELPARVLATEVALKGGSSRPDVALTAFVTTLAHPVP